MINPVSGSQIILPVFMPGIDYQVFRLFVQFAAVIEVQTFQKVETYILDFRFDLRVVVIARQITIDQGLDSIWRPFQVVFGPVA